jgi:radical SAM superfamily enzyme YgiQ (UPF0313 family)
MARICLINPRFRPSFWGLNYGLPLCWKKANMPVLALPVLAGLTPQEHEIALLDENIEEIDFDALEGFDIVGVTGMSVQRDRMREIVRELRARGVFTAVGGPWVSVQEDDFAELADVLFIGEAEETWPQFLEEWKRGSHQRRYEQPGKTDMTKVPLPRYDLVPLRRYVMGCIQTSRGCPFQCEFCDIIVIFGRRPRIKTPDQVVAEVDAHHRLGARFVFLVDDNFIGNKKATKGILRAIIDWQRQHGYPLAFWTQASLDLAEDAELMRLMAEAGFLAVFIGVESPSEESLRETRKYQNVRGSLLERIHRVQDAGLEVYAGMIIGFDHDDETVFERQFEFLRRSRISVATPNLLTAIPKTPLYRRLEAAGRLDNAALDDPETGTNVVHPHMSSQELRAGWVKLMERLYDADNYFERFDALLVKGRIPLGEAKMSWLRRHKPWSYLKLQAAIVVATLALLIRIFIHPRTRLYRQVYGRNLRKLLGSGLPLRYLFLFALRCIQHTHVANLIRPMASAASGSADRRWGWGCHRSRDPGAQVAGKGGSNSALDKLHSAV